MSASALGEVSASALTGVSASALAEVSASALADEAARLASADPHDARVLAARALELAKVEKDLATQARAERALGLAAMHGEGVSVALRHLRRAVALARRAGDPQLEGQVRVSLAGALSWRGPTSLAVREIDRALALLDGLDRIRGLAQRGMIMHRSGRLTEALDDYRRALPAIRKAGDDDALLALLLNRGATCLSLLDLPAARADLTEAALTADRTGARLEAAYARANLAFVETLAGDVPAALDHFATAAPVIRTSGAPVASLLSMKAELLLSVRLLPEAEEAAVEAADAFRRERDVPGGADCALLIAQILVADGRPAEATAYARRAEAAFLRLGRADLHAVARLVRLQSAHAAGGRGVTLGQVETLVDALTAAGRRSTANDARLLAYEVALPRQAPRALGHLERVSAARSVRGPASGRARAWYAEAMLREHLGAHRSAERAALAGLAVIDEHRAALPATDLRAHVAGHRTELVDLGLRIALRQGSARKVLRWAERGRATQLLQRPARPPTNPLLTERLAALRALTRDLFESPAGETSAERERLRHRQASLEREIRELARETTDSHHDPVGRPVDAGALAATLGDRALVEYVTVDGGLHAVSVVGGRCRLHGLGAAGELTDLLERVEFGLQRMIRAAGRPAAATAGASLIADASRRLDELLLASLTDLSGRDLVVVPTGALQRLPWSILPSCRGRAITVAPSASVWQRAMSRDAGDGSVVVAAGPGLPRAPEEATAIAALYGTVPMLGARASVAAVGSALGGAALAHVAAHGHLSARNPLFSHLLLADGPLVAYDLEQLPALPHTVVLAACESGQNAVRAGDELLGLGAVFLARGTAQLVGSLVPVPDAETSTLMNALHLGLAAGLSPAVALARAQADAAAAGPAAVAAAAGFVCLGAGFLPVLPEIAPSHPRNGTHVVTRLAPDAPVLDRHG